MKLILFAPVLIGLMFVNTASAQNISVVQGNGQLICDGCPTVALPSFDPMVVKVTDAAGKPIVGATVTWTVLSGIGGFNGGSFTTATTTTGSDASSAATPCTAIGQTCVQYIDNGTASTTFQLNAVSASLTNNNSVTFYLTQSPNPRFGNLQNATATLLSTLPISISGAAGSTFSTPIQVQVISSSNLTMFQNVSVQLFPKADNPPGGPTVTCAADAKGTPFPGADPGAVMTDNTGTANCYPRFGPVPSSGQIQVQFDILVGGVLVTQNQSNAFGVPGVPAGFADYFPVDVIVTSATPAGVQIISGNNPSLNRGQSTTLVGKVVDAGGNALGNQQVTWTVSPSGSATVNPATSTSDSTGEVSTLVTLSATALGTVQVKATTTNGSFATFSITVNSQVTGMTSVSGNNQSTPVGTAFANPLVVQISTSTGVLGNNAIQFAITGGSGTLTPANGLVATDNNGLAQVRVTAGSVAGNIAVVATVAGFSQTFSLTVIPPGPSITGNSFLNGAGFYLTNFGNGQTALSPCGIGTLVNGGALSAFPATPNMFAAPLQQPSPVTISFGNTAAPILGITGSAVGPQVYTFQVPCELVPNSYSVTVTVNNGSSTVSNVPVRPGAPGIFEIAMSDGIRRAVLVRPDGSFVSLANPARRGETVRMYITGGGPTQPAVATGSLPTPGVDVLPSDPNQIVVGVDNSGVVIVSARLAPELVGVWEIYFTVPTSARTGNDIVLSVAVTAEGNPPQFSQGSRIPIQ